MKEYIEIIEQFDTKEGKLYWIKALRVADSVKGYLVLYFGLLS